MELGAWYAVAPHEAAPGLQGTFSCILIGGTWQGTSQALLGTQYKVLSVTPARVLSTPPPLPPDLSSIFLNRLSPLSHPTGTERKVPCPHPVILYARRHDNMILPVLAPRPSRPAASVAPKPQPMPLQSDSEWAAVYLAVERLYVRERRTLRYVMTCMERTHGFRAT